MNASGPLPSFRCIARFLDFPAVTVQEMAARDICIDRRPDFKNLDWPAGDLPVHRMAARASAISLVRVPVVAEIRAARWIRE